jgi:hypothetical protein
MRSRMRRFAQAGLLAAPLLVLLISPVRAESKPTPEQRQLAARLLDTGKMLGLDNTFHAAPRAAAQGRRFPDEFPGDVVTRLQTLEATVLEKSAVPFREVLIDRYSAVLTPDQLREAADFLSTPAGQARVSFIQAQNRDPALQSGPVFRFDPALVESVKQAAGQAGLVVPDWP